MDALGLDPLLIKVDVQGSEFEVINGAVATKALLVLLAFSAFFRLVRGDPFSSLLLQTSRTKRLALGSWSTIGALVCAGALMYAFRTIESAMLGRLLGETLALAVTVYLARNLYRTALVDHLTATLSEP